MADVAIVEAVRIGGVEQRRAGIERRANDGHPILVVPIGGGRQPHTAESDHSSGGWCVGLLHELLHGGDELASPVQSFIQSVVLPAKCLPRGARFPAVDRSILRRIIRDALKIRTDIALGHA